MSETQTNQNTCAGTCDTCSSCPTYSSLPQRVIFTEEMRKEYTILIPTMLPRHFKIISKVFNRFGYHTELLEDGTHGDSQTVIDMGLKYVHNDACFPALLVIGQFLTALNSGRYDTDKVALLLTQTGGGCRASNYIPLLRKALARAGYAHVPVVSLNFAGLEHMPGFKITLPMVHRMLYAILYGDLLLSLVNQCRPYERVKGTTEKLADRWSDRLAEEMMDGTVRYSKVKKNYQRIIDDFAAIDMDNDRRKNTVRVGIVGEIFVKFSPLGNNNLEQFLIDEGAEPVMGGLLDFCLFVVSHATSDYALYGTGRTKASIYKIVDRFFIKKQNDMIRIIKEDGRFRAPTPFRHTQSLTEGVVNQGVKMGEGWLLTAEMLELIDQGIGNIVCAQPFGCLPNHIVGKGMMKPIKERYPHVNLVAIDYDAGATKINQDNRIKLMLANARREMEQSAQ